MRQYCRKGECERVNFLDILHRIEEAATDTTADAENRVVKIWYIVRDAKKASA